MVTQVGAHVPSAKESSVETESACDRLTGRVVHDQSRIYSCAYDRRLRHPAWDEGPVGDRTRSNFTEDESLPAIFRAKLQDYFRSGYDRGHMVPAADATSASTHVASTVESYCVGRE
ncbi:hypothetical protein EV363DRAFT_1191649 [Boletus edulis]|uniref:Endonuclease n=1 Tax=Boletus edulis BED1 TaxID=1328754 RepID=A0AAD4BHB3_BOLED|nr:hypothetical protein EV363DRAFT_1191649 [Boletus edulis]KAF8430512.1 hypothetical protein L210DRAFT_931184 [Boletus edulis BED1]